MRQEILVTLDNKDLLDQVVILVLKDLLVILDHLGLWVLQVK